MTWVVVSESVLLESGQTVDDGVFGRAILISAFEALVSHVVTLGIWYSELVLVHSCREVFLSEVPPRDELGEGETRREALYRLQWSEAHVDAGEPNLQLQYCTILWFTWWDCERNDC